MSEVADEILEFVCGVQKEAQDKGDLLVWTICCSPADYPDKFTARPHSTRQGQSLGFVLTEDTLEAIRALLPPGLHQMPRSAFDPPTIVECWF